MTVRLIVIFTLGEKLISPEVLSYLVTIILGDVDIVVFEVSE